MENAWLLIGFIFQVSYGHAFAGSNADDGEQMRYSLGFLSAIPEIAGTLDIGTAASNSNAGAHENDVTRTESPLEKALNSFHGNPDWREAISQASVTSQSGPTASPLQEHFFIQTTKPEGFFGMQLSGHSFNLEQNNGNRGLDATQLNRNTISPLIESQKTSNTGGLLKGVLKTIGSQEHPGHGQTIIPSSRTSNVDQMGMSQLSMSPATAGISLNQQSHGETQLPTTSNLLQAALSNTPPANLDLGNFIAPSELVTSESGQQQSQTHTIGNIAFNPDTVNSQQNLFQPGSSFVGFMTQTGSNPENYKGEVSNYDPNAVNKDYLNQIINGIFEKSQGSGMSSEQSPYGGQQSSYRFSAYQHTQPSYFDSNALNKALVQQQETTQHQNMRTPFLFGSNSNNKPTTIPATTKTEEKMASHIDNDPSIKPSQRINFLVTPTSPSKSTSSPKPIPMSQTLPKFGFVPGNLYPGQSYSSNQGSSIVQEVSSPTFLHNIPIGMGTFNPNVLNAAQNLYNPNSESWIRSKRDTGAFKDINQAYFYEGAGGSSESNNMNQTVGNKTSNAAYGADNNFNSIKDSPHTEVKSSATPVPSLSVTTTPSFPTKPNIAMKTTSLSSPVAPTESPRHQGFKAPSPTPSYAPGGFNADRINAMQTSFVPGQMVGTALYGAGTYMGGTYVSNEPQNATTGSDNGQAFKGGGLGIGASMNFNILSLLGMGKNSNMTTTFGGGMETFNPNIINTIFSGPTGDKVNGSIVKEANTGDNSGGGGSFDPNTANDGFGNVLKGGFGFIQKGTSSGFGMAFDPNVGKVGFGASGFGIGHGGAYSLSTAFDPNRLNSMGVGFGGAKTNNTINGIDGMMAFFLGVPGGGSNESNQGTSRSNFIADFNPDLVNRVSYNPDDFNSGRMHFTPVDMLSSNPGMDKDTLVASASSFDPDKLNNPNSQLAFSPIDVLSANPGFDKGTLSHVTYSTGALGTNRTSNGNLSPTNNGSETGYNQQGSHQQTIFDPVAVMKKLLQAARAYIPGLANAQTQSFDPMVSMFGMKPVTGSASTMQTTTSVPSVTSTLSPTQMTTQTTLNSGRTTETTTSTTTASLLSTTGHTTVSTKPST